MTLPDNIKAEIEKAAEELSMWPINNNNDYRIDGNQYEACVKIATQFYERGRREGNMGGHGGAGPGGGFVYLTPMVVIKDDFKQYKKQGGEG